MIEVFDSFHCGITESYFGITSGKTVLLEIVATGCENPHEISAKVSYCMHKMKKAEKDFQAKVALKVVDGLPD